MLLLLLLLLARREVFAKHENIVRCSRGALRLISLQWLQPPFEIAVLEWMGGKDRIGEGSSKSICYRRCSNVTLICGYLPSSRTPRRSIPSCSVRRATIISIRLQTSRRVMPSDFATAIQSPRWCRKMGRQNSAIRNILSACRTTGGSTTS